MTRPEMITTQELAERWGIKPGTLSIWRHRGRSLPKRAPPEIYGARPIKYLLSDVIAFEAEHGVNTNG